MVFVGPVRTVVHCTALLQHCFNLIGGGPGGPKGEIPATIARNGRYNPGRQQQTGNNKRGKMGTCSCHQKVEKERMKTENSSERVKNLCNFATMVYEL